MEGFNSFTQSYYHNYLKIFLILSKLIPLTLQYICNTTPKAHRVTCFPLVNKTAQRMFFIMEFMSVLG